MERSRDWLEQALWDLEHAKSDLERGFYDWACFSAQQAAKKAVKAVFQKMGAEAWGHSVADLLQELSKRQDVPESLIDGALELDKAYIPALSQRPFLRGSEGQIHDRRGQEAHRTCEKNHPLLYGSFILSSTKKSSSR